MVRHPTAPFLRFALRHPFAAALAFSPWGFLVFLRVYRTLDAALAGGGVAFVMAVVLLVPRFGLARSYVERVVAEDDAAANPGRSPSEGGPGA